MNPLVSIVIVAHNNWPDLEMAVQSALCQSYKPLEVIVIDNASTDATALEVQTRFSPRVRYLRQPNVGDAGAYNAGLRETRGEFLQFLDGDDVLTPYKIARQIEVFQSDPDADIIYGDTRLFQSREGTSLMKDTKTATEDDLLGVFLESSGDYFGNTLGLLLRRGAMEKIGAWDQTVYVTDTDYWLRALSAGCRFRHCPDALMGFVGVGLGKMSSNRGKMLKGHEALWIKALDHVKREPYRSLVWRNLAKTRFLRALLDEGATRGEAFKLLSSARAACPAALPLAAYAAGALAVLLPGGRALTRSPRLRLLRQAAARLAGYQAAG